MQDQDKQVLLGTRPEELAAAISSCRVDALAFDGIEQLFSPVYKISPGAKVLLMNWRTFEQWQKSLTTFVPELLFEIWFMGLLGGSLQALGILEG